MRTTSDGQPAGDHDVAVVGGGLAGLTAAVTAARTGASVVVVEARETLGGRARSDETQGFVVNHGAHAFYRGGAAAPILRGLGVRPSGSVPLQRGFGWWVDEKRVRGRSVSAVGGVDGMRALGRVARPGGRAADAPGRSMEDWLDRHVPERGRPVAEMAVRTACYAADLEHLDAAAALRQVAAASRGVLYLHGGWQTVVDALADRARAAGVVFRTGRVEAVTSTATGTSVELRGAATIRARAVVVASGGAASVDALVHGASPSVRRWAEGARPVAASCLDVAAAGSPRRRPRSTYGLGEPVYLVDHAATARVAPRGGAVHHGLFYEPDRRPEVDHRATLEAMLDVADPGWRDRTVSVAFRRHLVVAHDRPQPARDGVDRPTVQVPDLANVYVAGDWITDRGMLADAAVASAAEAGRLAAGDRDGAGGLPRSATARSVPGAADPLVSTGRRVPT